MKSNGKYTFVDDRGFCWFAASFLILFFASKSLGLTLGYALDDYATLNAASGRMQGFLLSQGRFTFALLQFVLDRCDLKQPELAGLGFFLCAGGFLLICWFTLADWIKKNLVLAVAVGALLGAHPFFAEYISFRQSLFPMGVCFALIAGATFMLAHGAPGSFIRSFASAGLAATASGINQIALAFFCIAVLSISLQKRSLLPLRQKMFFALRDTALAGALASVIYFGVFAFSRYGFDVDSNARMSMIAFGAIASRVVDVWGLLISVFGGSHVLVGSLAASFTAFAFVALGFRVSITGGQWSNVLIGMFVIALGAALALVPASLSGVWWPMPRTLIALPLAVVLGISVLSVGASRAQVRVASVALLIAATIFAGKSGALLIDQQRLNRWDMALAREIVFKISEDRKIDASTSIAIHGATWGHEVDRNMPIGDGNLSALSVAWAVDALFEEASGRNMRVTLGVEEDKVCAGAPRFPTGGSIFVVDGTINVCL